ncbi:hypothetical protein DMN91_005146 [Ooceraea biroi]|uniref:Thioesterase domain-containing protein n=2 Tax=Ooceraea biroi TaxID=2015173 RepID=A0A3L8DSX6_OOCBI|nr:acyl-coenzyme A thioesterase 13 [Ooceraea biroi]RLU22868.1 hypothetical protein DMN91_005146 [Ooceraea biroi]
MSRGLEFAKSVLKTIATSPGFGRSMKGVHILSAGDGKCKAQFTVAEEHLNMAGTLHGGFTSTIIDCVSTYAVMTHKDCHPGVSVNLNVTFIKAAFPGETVTVDAQTVRAGKKLAFLAVELTKNDGKDVVARGEHTKYIAMPDG